MKSPSKLILFLLLSVLVGCKDQRDIETYRVPKEAPEPRAEAGPDTEMWAQADGQVMPPRQPTTLPEGHPPLPQGHPPLPQGQQMPEGHPPVPQGHPPMPPGHPPMPGAPGRDEAVAWTAPQGWQSLPSDGMRAAVFHASANQPEVQITVVPLGGGAADIAANVNRWEQQLSLVPSSEQELKQIIRRVNLDGGLHADVVDLTGVPPGADGQRFRMIAAIVPRGQTTWFFRIVGPADLVAQHKASFDAFVASIRPAEPTTAPAPAAAQAAAPQTGRLRLSGWKAPPGWVQDPPRQMRLMSFTIGEAPNQATLIASKFPRGGVGGLLDNINRWRTQVNLQPVNDPAQQPFGAIRVGPYEGKLYEMAGPQNKQFVVWADLGEESWFFRLVGPAEVVTQQKQNLEQFIQSLQFEDETR